MMVVWRTGSSQQNSLSDGEASPDAGGSDEELLEYDPKSWKLET